MDKIILPWDVWWVRFPRDDSFKNDIRPGLILDVDDQTITFTIVKMTSHPPRPGEYALRDWEQTGLSVPTTVRIYKQALLHRRDVLSKIGVISNYDKQILNKLLL